MYWLGYSAWFLVAGRFVAGLSSIQLFYTLHAIVLKLALSSFFFT